MNLIPPCNFRPVLPNNENKSPISLYRSNCLDDDHSEAVSWLRNTMKINTFIDLRSDKEIKEISKLDDHYKRIIDKDVLFDETSFVTFGYRHFLELKVFNFDIRTLDLITYYNGILEGCQDVFHRIFTLMANPYCYPMVISCSYGKDRTGVLAALIMQLMGYNDEIIIDEYAISEKNLSPIKEQLENVIRKIQLRPEFSLSPPEAMKSFLHFLRDKYGDARGFLILCGITNEQIDNIKKNLVAK